ncbi:unnamed protein product [Musa textilis]
MAAMATFLFGPPPSSSSSLSSCLSRLGQPAPLSSLSHFFSTRIRHRPLSRDKPASFCPRASAAASGTKSRPQPATSGCRRCTPSTSSRRPSAPPRTSWWWWSTRRATAPTAAGSTPSWWS